MAIGKTNAGGGGPILPDEIVAGDTVVLALLYYSAKSDTGWGPPSTGSPKQIEIKKSGTYRFKYHVASSLGTGAAGARLSKNGMEVEDSEIMTSAVNGVHKVVDVALLAEDIIALELYRGSATTINNLLAVSILAPDIQEAIDEIIVQDI